MDVSSILQILDTWYEEEPTEVLESHIVDLALLDRESCIRNRILEWAGPDLELGAKAYYNKYLRPLWYDSRPYSEKLSEIEEVAEMLGKDDEWILWASTPELVGGKEAYERFCLELFG